jgi:hypothetical protein
MAACAGIYLADRHTGGCNALRVVIGLLIPFDHRKSEFAAHSAQGSFQNTRLAGTGRADQVENKNALVFEQGAVEGGQFVVLGQNILFYCYYGTFTFVMIVCVVSMIMTVSGFVPAYMIVAVIERILGAAAAGCAHNGFSGNGITGRNGFRRTGCVNS